MNFYIAEKKKGNKNILLIKTKPGINFFDLLHHEDRFKGIYSFELIEGFIDIYMESFNKKKVTDIDVRDFLDKLEKHLKANLQEYWLIAPLNGALLNVSEIITDNLILLNGSKESAQIYLKSLLGEEYYTYIKQDYLKADYEDVLIGYKILCQTDYIDHYYNILSYYLNSLIHFYYFAVIYPDYDYKNNEMKYFMEKAHIQPRREDLDIKRVILFSKLNPMSRVARYDTNCEIDLSFFREEEYMSEFKEIVNYLIKEIPARDVLGRKLLNVLILFKESIEVEKNQKFLGISLPIVLLTTASESLFLNHNDIKRENLKNILSEIYDESDLSNNKIRHIVDQVYSLRSEFVHGGTAIFRDFKDDFSDGEKTELFKNFKKIFTRDMYLIIKYLLTLDESERNLNSYEAYVSVHKVKKEKSLIKKLLSLFK